MRVVRGSVLGERRIYSLAEKRDHLEAIGRYLTMGCEPPEAEAQLRRAYEGISRSYAKKMVQRVLKTWAEDQEKDIKKNRAMAVRRYHLLFRQATQRFIGEGKNRRAVPDLKNAVAIAARLDKIQGLEAPQVHVIGEASDITDAMRQALTEMDGDYIQEALAEQAQVYAAAAALKQQHGDAMAKEYAQKALILGMGEVRHQVTNGSKEDGGVAVGGGQGSVEQNRITRPGSPDSGRGIQGPAPGAHPIGASNQASQRQPNVSPKPVHRATTGASKPKR